MAEVLLEFPDTTLDSEHRAYRARACGAIQPDGKWHGWIEFIPLADGEPVRTPRETTQPNYQDSVYWATGLTPVYLEGALERALHPLRRAPTATPEPPLFSEPAPRTVGGDAVAASRTTSILDPFSVYEKGEALLRTQLSSLSTWHLVNIALDYDLTSEHPTTLNSLSGQTLIELIVAGVKQQTSVKS
jgi:hypothetical protein